MKQSFILITALLLVSLSSCSSTGRKLPKPSSVPESAVWHDSDRKWYYENTDSYLVFFQNGVLNKKAMVADGKLNGIVQVWDISGNKESISKMIDGKLDGEILFWWPNGNIMVKGLFSKGQKEGEWLIYNEKGILSYRQVYKADRLINESKI